MDGIFKTPSYSAIFKDEATLQQNYVPEMLPHREEELKRLSRDFKPLLEKKGAFSVNVAVVGDAGLGKTAMVKYFSGKFPALALKEGQKVKFQYYNCQTFRTKSAIMRHAVKSHGNVFTTRGFSDTELLSDLLKALKKENSHLVLILDEANVLGSEGILEFIYLPESFDYGHSRISNIIISRRTEFKALLEVHLSERLNQTIEVPGYGRDQLHDILQYRSELAFREGVVSPAVLDQVLDIATGTQNARHGIEILYNAGKIADEQKAPEVSPEMVRLAKSYVYPELKSNVFEELKEDELLAAIGIARHLKHEHLTGTSIEGSYEYYKIACEERGKEPKAVVTYRRFVKTLDGAGVISSVVKAVEAGRGRSGIITLQDIPAEVLEEKCVETLNKMEGKN